MQQSLDGFVAGPKGELDWMQPDWDADLEKYLMELTSRIDCILMGRRMKYDFCNYWEKAAQDLNGPEHAFARIMVDTPKVIFSKTLEKAECSNARIASQDLVEEVNWLKNQPGKDLIVYGGVEFVRSLLEHHLIDELYLFINPIAIGKGMRIFDSKTKFSLVESRSFTSGIQVMHYRPSQVKE